MRLKFIIVAISLLLSKLIFSQSIESQTETWFQVFANVRLHEKWSLVGDAGLRREEKFVQKHFQNLTRVGLMHHFGQNTVTLGYAFFITDGNLEHRSYQFLVLPQSFGKIQLRHRYRFEQRWREQPKNDTYMFNYRFGYQINITIPLKGQKMGPKVPFLLIQDEVFVNFGKNIRNNFFDQNRFLVGFGYQFSKNITSNIGYQYNFVQRAGPETFEQINCIRLNTIFNFDIRKPKEEPVKL